MKTWKVAAALVVLGLSHVAAQGNLDRHGSAKITFGTGVDDLTPTDINIWFTTATSCGTGSGDDGVQCFMASDRIEIHLPYFGGAYNSFGLASADAPKNTGETITCLYPFNTVGGGTCGTTSVPSRFLEGYDATSTLVANSMWAKAMEWDARREILKIQLISGTPTQVYKIVIKAAAMTFPSDFISGGNMPNGLGPLPPRGGIDEDWYLKAYVKHFRSSDCTAATTNTLRLGHQDTCGGSTSRLTTSTTSDVQLSVSSSGKLYVFTSSNVQQFATEHPVMPSTMIGATGTMQKATFSFAKASGTSNGPGRDNCITVSFISNVALTSAASRSTTITVSGLANSLTADKDSIDISLGNKCQSSTHVASTAAHAFFGTAATAAAGATPSSTVASGWSVDFNQADGKLTLQMGGGYHIEAGELFVFSFTLTNPTVNQDAQDIMISSDGPVCVSRNLCQASQPSVASSIGIEAVEFVSKTRVLESRAPYFRTAKFFQSTDNPDTEATIFVTLRPNIDITPQTDDEVVTITGLCGTVSDAPKITLLNNNDGSTLDSPTDAVTNSIVQTSADWDKEKGQLKVTLSAAMEGNTRYAFSFKWKTVDEKSDACSIMVSSPNRGFMEQDATNVGDSVGTVKAPQFTRFKIGQVTTRPEAINFVCVTLRTNSDFESKSTGENDLSTITIKGLTGTKASSTTGAALYVCPSTESVVEDWKDNALGPLTAATTANGGSKAVAALGANGQGIFTSDESLSTADSKFIFDADKGEVTLKVHPGAKITAGSSNEIVFAIPFENDKVDRECSDITMVASGSWDQEVTMVQTATGRALQDSLVDGDACALRIYKPQFLVRVISQSTPLAEATNTITVSIKPNMYMFSATSAGSAKVTISGLTKTDSSDDAVSSITNLDGSAGLDLTATGADIDWVGSTGTLTLTMPQLANLAACKATTTTTTGTTGNQCMKPGTTYVFTFQITNPPDEQSAPDVSIGGINDDADVFEMLMMNAPISSALKALRIVPKSHIMRDFDIGQLAAAPDTRNAICVTLRPWKTISGETSGVGSTFETLTISGLVQYQGSDQELVVYSTDGSKYTSVCNFMKIDDESTDGCEDTTTAAPTTYENRVTYNRNDLTVKTKLKSLTTSKTTFCFLVQNPASATSCPELTMTLNTDDGTQVETMDQDTSGKLQYYPVGSTCAGFVSEKKFLTKVLRSSSNVTSADNRNDPAYMIADFWPNFKIEAGDIIQISGLSGYDKAGADSDVKVQYHKNGLENWLTFDDEATFGTDGTLSFTVNAGQTGMVAVNDYEYWATGVTANIGSDKEFWEFTFLLSNSPSEQDAPNIQVSVGSAQDPAADFSKASMTTGMDDEPELRNAKKRIDNVKVRRQGSCGVSDLEIEFTAPVDMYGGETLLIDMPHAEIDTEGAIYGITATIGDTDDTVDAFETYESQDLATQNGRNEDKASAIFYEGFVGDSDEKTGDTGKYLDGFVRLNSADDGYEANKEGWQVDTEAFLGLSLGLKTTTTTAPGCTTECGGAYEIASVVSGKGTFLLNSTSIVDLYDDADEAYLLRLLYKEDSTAGLYLVCGNEVRMIMTNGNFTLHTDDAFKSLTEYSPNGGSFTTCMIKNKQVIGKYTGMNGMIGETAVTFIQGGGDLYTVIDGSGSAPAYTDLEKKQYAVYSRLEITTANGESVQKGTTVKIKIPKSSGIDVPCNQDDYVTGDTDSSKHTIAEQTKMALMFFSTLAGSTANPHVAITNLTHPTVTTFTSTVDLSEMRPNIGKSSFDTNTKSQLENKEVLFFGALHYAGKATLSADEVASTGSLVPTSLDNFWTNNFAGLGLDSAYQEPYLDGTNYANAPVVYGGTLETAGTTQSVGPMIGMRVLTNWSGPIAGAYSMTASATIQGLGTDGIEPETLIGFPYSAHPNSTTEHDRRLKSGTTLYNWGMVGEMLGSNEYTSTASDNAGFSKLVSNNDATIESTADKTYEAFAFQQPALISSVQVPSSTDFMREQMRLTIENKAIRQRLSANVRAGIILQDFFTFPLAEGSSSAPEKKTFTFSFFGGTFTFASIGAVTASLAAGETMEKYTGCETACNVPSNYTGAGTILAASPALMIVSEFPVDLTFPLLYNIDAEAVAALLSGRRRLLAAPEGFEYRIAEINTPGSACNCPPTTEGPATCPDRPSGTYQAILLSVDECAEETTTAAPSGGDNTGAIVGGVIGGIAGLLILAAAAYFCCQSPQEEQPWAKPTPAAATQQMVPVYLPEQYPELGGSAYPQAPATFDAALPPQPMAPPMGMSAQPMAPPMGMSAPIMQPTLYQSQDPALMYSSQQPGMYPQPQPVLYASQQPYGAYGM